MHRERRDLCHFEAIEVGKPVRAELLVYVLATTAVDEHYSQPVFHTHTKFSTKFSIPGYSSNNYKNTSATRVVLEYPDTSTVLFNFF